MKKGVYGVFKLLNISYKNNMEIGIISDIHGNIDALNCVLKTLSFPGYKHVLKIFYGTN